MANCPSEALTEYVTYKKKFAMKPFLYYNYHRNKERKGDSHDRNSKMV